MRRTAVVISVGALTVALIGVSGASGSVRARPGPDESGCAPEAVAPGVAGPGAVGPGVAGKALTAANERAAVRLAEQCGTQVEILTGRTAHTQVFANPSGSQTATISIEPQRAQRPDGSWTAIDTSLRRDGDAVVPGATLADVRFSTGGDGPLVTWRSEGHTFSLSWPAPLPAPVLAADSATYPNVLPDVDLVVRATPTGFTHVLVVKTKAAAASPALRQIRYRVGGDARLGTTPEGGLVARAGGKPIVSAGEAVMWDAGARSTDTHQGRSTPADAVDAAQQSDVGTRVVGSDLVLTPDPALLTDPDLQLPLYIDPAFGTPNTYWAYATINNENGPTTDTTIGSGDPYPAATQIRIGNDPDSARVYRSFVMFPFTANGMDLRGKKILNAILYGRVDHTHYCAPGTNTAYFCRSGAISVSPRPAWPGPSMDLAIGSVTASANERACTNANVPFEIGGVGSALMNDIQLGANQWWPGYTMGVGAGSDTGGAGETNSDRWMRLFRDEFYLSVEFNTKPATPTNLRTTSPTTGCVTGPSRPVISDPTPLLTAFLADGDNTNLQAEFDLYITNGGPIGEPPLTTGKLQGQDFTYQVPSSGPLALLNGNNYSWRVRAYDGVEYGDWAWWCEFTIDTVPPSAPPGVSSATYPENQWGGGVGTPGTFTFTAGNSDVSSFRYGFNTGTPSISVNATTLGGSSSPVSFTPSQFGPNFLSVRSVDRAGGLGPIRTYVFKVNGSDPVAWWKFDEGTGTTAADSTGHGHTATLDAIGWGDGRHNLTDPTDLGLNAPGAFPSRGETTGPVLDTSKSFTVTAWVRLNSFGGNRMVMTQDGSQVGAFFIGLEGNFTNTWAMWMQQADSVNSPPDIAWSNVPAQLDTWTHLAGVYDHQARTISIYVDGVLAGTASHTSTWNATGKLAIGRGLFGVWGDYWPGALDDIRVFPGPLDESQIFTIYSEFRP
ncbi:MAG: LamG domain-containing protein [Sporichthyaceae bacterium]|nr:LamG domain-containing protein [Sporichthyaceae bacterium]